MELDDLTCIIPNLAGMSHADKVKLFAWHIHTYKNQDRLSLADLRSCYDQLHYVKPANLTGCILQLQQKKKPELLKDRRGYRLEGRLRAKYDAKYGTRPVTIAVDSMLAELPGKISNEAERLFLDEAISCFRIKAYRAAIVMTWNVAYDHFIEWIIRNHLPAFNARIPANFPKRSGVSINKKEDFSSHFKEAEVIDIAKSAGFLHDNIKKILNDKLTRRNLAAHPSLIAITQYQAEDAISDLVNNVILQLL